VVLHVGDVGVGALRGAFSTNCIIRPRDRISGLPAAQRAVVLDRHPHKPPSVDALHGLERLQDQL
jgi:hypothetical protein